MLSAALVVGTGVALIGLLSWWVSKQYRFRRTAAVDQRPVVRVCGTVVRQQGARLTLQRPSGQVPIATDGAAWDGGRGPRSGAWVTVDAVATWLPASQEQLYRHPGRHCGFEALRIIHGRQPGARAVCMALCGIALFVAALAVTPWHFPGGSGPHVAELDCPSGAHQVSGPRFPRGWVLGCQRDADGVRHGEWGAWDGHGLQLMRGHYRAGVRHGPWTTWYEGGPKRVDGSYRNGKRHGLWTEYTSTGSRRVRGVYRAGQRHGRWTWWGDQGRRTRTMDWESGQPNGLDAAWNLDGSPRWRGRRVQGLAHGRWSVWGVSCYALNSGLMRDPAAVRIKRRAARFDRLRSDCEFDHGGLTRWRGPVRAGIALRAGTSR